MAKRCGEPFAGRGRIARASPSHALCFVTSPRRVIVAPTVAPLHPMRYASLGSVESLRLRGLIVTSCFLYNPARHGNITPRVDVVIGALPVPRRR